MIGRKIHRFLILEELGRGGMASVWKARDQLLGRLVAVKVLGEDLSRSAPARRRFQREARIAALLEHPSIVPVYEAGEDEGVAYLVMRLIDGETLAQFVARRLPPMDEVVRITRTVVEALGYAHGRGVVHRDVTSRNIMLTPAGGVYVLDFGLARVAGDTISSSSHLVGTPAFLAPETLRGEETDARSDLYSFGVVLYQMLTGMLPFRGERAEVLSYNSLHASLEPPSRLRPEIAPSLDQLVMRLLSRDPAERPQSAEETLMTLGRERPADPAETSGGRAEPALHAAGGSAGPAGAQAPKDPPGDAALVERLLSGQAHVYLAVLPIESPDDVAADGARTQLLRGLTDAARAGLAQLARLHVVAVEHAPGADEDLKTFARRVGANLVLRSTSRFAGSTARVTFALVDPERGLQVAGGSADGSALQPFELEDRFVVGVRQALGLHLSAEETGWRIRPRDPAAQERFSQAQSYLRRFDHEASVDGAITLLEGLLQTEGESAAVHSMLARAYLHKYRNGDHRIWESRAAQACERATRLDPSAPEVMLAVGELHAVGGRHAEALAGIDRVLAARPDFFEAHLARARSLDGAGQAAESEAVCRRAIDLKPDDWRGYHALGLMLFRHGRYAEAVGPWQQVTVLAPDNANAHRNLGSALFHLDRYEEAIAAFNRCNEIRPQAMAFTNLGTVLFTLGRYDECGAAFEKAVALSPTDPRAWGNLGNACRRIPGREARTLEALQRAVGLMQERFDRSPGEGEDWARLAGWFANLGRLDEAERAIRRGLEMAPDDVHSMIEAAQVFVKLGARDEAIHWLRRAVESGYGVDALRRSPELLPLAGDAEFERILKQGSEKPGTRQNSRNQEGRPS